MMKPRQSESFTFPLLPFEVMNMIFGELDLFTLANLRTGSIQLNLMCLAWFHQKLQNPSELLNLIHQIKAEYTVGLVQTFFRPVDQSSLYQVLKKKAEEPTASFEDLLAFSIITNDMRKLNYDLLGQRYAEVKNFELDYKESISSLSVKHPDVHFALLTVENSQDLYERLIGVTSLEKNQMYCESYREFQRMKSLWPFFLFHYQHLTELRNANFRIAILPSIQKNRYFNLANTVVTLAPGTQPTIPDIEFSNINFEKATFDHVIANNVSFSSCHLRDIAFRNCRFETLTLNKRNLPLTSQKKFWNEFYIVTTVKIANDLIDLKLKLPGKISFENLTNSKPFGLLFSPYFKKSCIQWKIEKNALSEDAFKNYLDQFLTICNEQPDTTISSIKQIWVYLIQLLKIELIEQAYLHPFFNSAPNDKQYQNQLLCAIEDKMKKREFLSTHSNLSCATIATIVDTFEIDLMVINPIAKIETILCDPTDFCTFMQNLPKGMIFEIINAFCKPSSSVYQALKSSYQDEQALAHSLIAFSCVTNDIQLFINLNQKALPQSFPDYFHTLKQKNYRLTLNELIELLKKKPNHYFNLSNITITASDRHLDKPAEFISFSGLNFANTVFEGITFPYSRFINCNLAGAKFINCSFNGIYIENANTESILFYNSQIIPYNQKQMSIRITSSLISYLNVGSKLNIYTRAFSCFEMDPLLKITGQEFKQELDQLQLILQEQTEKSYQDLIKIWINFFKNKELHFEMIQIAYRHPIFRYSTKTGVDSHPTIHAILSLFAENRHDTNANKPTWAQKQLLEGMQMEKLQNKLTG